VFRARSLRRHGEGLEFEIDTGPGELMRNACGAARHVSRSEHPQHVGTKLFHDFAVARGEFTRPVRRNSDRDPRSIHGFRVGCVRTRRCQGIKGEIRPRKFIRAAEPRRAGARPCRSVRPRSGCNEQHLQFIGQAVARVGGCESHELKRILMLLPHAGAVRRGIIGKGATPCEDGTRCEGGAYQAAGPNGTKLKGGLHDILHKGCPQLLSITNCPPDGLTARYP
jgi:hypothetical protein